MSDNDRERDDVLRRMLRTSPTRHTPVAPRKRPTPRWVDKSNEEAAKGADADLDKMARLIGTKE